MSPARWRLVSFLALQYTQACSRQLDDSAASRVLRHCQLGACPLGHQRIARQILLWPNLILCFGFALCPSVLASPFLFVHRGGRPGFLALCLAGGCEAYVIPQIVCFGQSPSNFRHWPDRASPSFACRFGCHRRLRFALAIDLLCRDGTQRLCRGRFVVHRSPVPANRQPSPAAGIWRAIESWRTGLRTALGIPRRKPARYCLRSKRRLRALPTHERARRGGSVQRSGLECSMRCPFRPIARRTSRACIRLLLREARKSGDRSPPNLSAARRSKRPRKSSDQCCGFALSRRQVCSSFASARRSSHAGAYAV